MSLPSRALKGAVFIFTALIVAPANRVQAAEHGLGFYLLGSKGPLAAVLPPPGIYFQNDAYFYNGDISASRELPLGGNVAAGVKARAFTDLPTVLWATPYDLLGGKLAFSVTTPIGGPHIDANVTIGPFTGSRSDNLSTFGDPVAAATLGWVSGNFHWSVTGMTNVPIGDYREGALSNIAFHRWGEDLSFAGTWFDPSIGLDVSGVAGVTLNGENPATDYRTGTEFHFEGAISQYLSKEISIGVIGYYYQQISGDSGAGARLGAFKGRVAALGATASYTFQVDDLPVTSRVKLEREFDVKNRLQGTAGFVTLSMPLYVHGK